MHRIDLILEISTCLVELGKVASHLIEKDAHELAIASELKVILEKTGKYKEFKIDTDYNKKGNRPKVLDGHGVRPDLIIHIPDEDGTIRAHNFLAIEIKKRHHPQKDKEHAKANLKKMLAILNYQNALYVEITTKVKPTEGNWFQVEKIIYPA